MDKNSCYTSLSQILEIELTESQSLEKLLRQESKLLPGESEELIKISDAKSVIIAKLEQYNAQRNALAQSTGFSPDHHGLESCVAWCDRNNTLRDIWRQFLDTIQQCQSLNNLNGSIMDNGLRVVRQALSVLHGQAVNPHTYNANGEEEHDKLSRTLVKA